MEACRKWNHYLAGKKFLLITDQQAVSFMFSKQNHGKVKNDKIQRWRIELSTLDFDIRFRPGPLNVTADCLSRACMLTTRPSIRQIHEEMCHPGIVRLNHFVKTRNLPFSLADVKKVVSECSICARIKPRFVSPQNPPLIEATKPFDRLSIDFKGPLPSQSRNVYLLVIIDEYSRFPFAYPCQNMESSTIIKCLSDLFSIFGTAGFIHSDNGPSLVSAELRKYFLDNGIGYSNSSKYNPRGNGQCERYVGVIWKSVQLALLTKGLPSSHWESVLPEVLHSQRTLLCTATNQAPHERLFSFQRRSVSGSSVPSWLREHEKVLVKRHVRKSKYEPLCDEANLIAINPTHGKIQYASGREDIVSLRDIAPCPPVDASPGGVTLQPYLDGSNAPPVPPGPVVNEERREAEAPNSMAPLEPSRCELSNGPPPPPLPLRRSMRESRRPDYYQAG